MSEDEKELLELLNKRIDSTAYFVSALILVLDEHQIYGFYQPGELLGNFCETNNEIVEKLNAVVDRLNALKVEA